MSAIKFTGGDEALDDIDKTRRVKLNQDTPQGRSEEYLSGLTSSSKSMTMGTVEKLAMIIG